MGNWTIQMLEQHVRDNARDREELLLVLQELGHRTTHRAMELKELVLRMRGADAAVPLRDIGPLFTGDA